MTKSRSSAESGPYGVVTVPALSTLRPVSERSAYDHIGMSNATTVAARPVMMIPVPVKMPRPLTGGRDRMVPPVAAPHARESQVRG